jgi:hypothetical protein
MFGHEQFNNLKVQECAVFFHFVCDVSLELPITSYKEIVIFGYVKKSLNGMMLTSLLIWGGVLGHVASWIWNEEIQ